MSQMQNACTIGNCQFCSQKEDCVLYSLLQKVERMENALAEKSA